MSESLPIARPAEEAQRLLDGTQPHDEYVRRVRYEHGGGRMYRAVPRGQGEDRSLILDVYQEGDREFYFRAHDIVRALLAERGALRETLEAIVNEPHGCPMCDLGKLRNPEKEHWDTCPFAKAAAILDHV